MTSRSAHIFLVCVFLAVICGVGLMQVVAELNRVGSSGARRRPAVQFLDPVFDVFVAPSRRARRIAELYEVLNSRVDTVGSVLETRGRGPDALQGEDSLLPRPEGEVFDYSRVELAAEEALFVAGDLLRTIRNVNRYVTVDTTDDAGGKPVNAPSWTIDAIVEPAENQYRRASALVKELERLYTAGVDMVPVDQLVTMVGRVREEMRRGERHFRRPGPLGNVKIMLQHCLRYTLFSREYLRAYETEIEDGSVAAQMLRKPMRFMRYVLLKDAGSKAVVGENGWLFYRPGVDYLVKPSVIERPTVQPVWLRASSESSGAMFRDAVVDTIRSFRDKLQARGVELLVVIVPGKASIYPDLLNSSISPAMAGRISHTLALMHVLNEKGVETVDLFTPFAEARKGDPEEALYLAGDTHWRPRGLRIAAATVADRIRQYPWFRPGGIGFTVDTVTVEREGDIGVMAKLPTLRLFKSGVRFPPETVRCLQVSSPVGGRRVGEAGKRLYHTLKGEYVRDSEILIIGDSFSRIYQEDAPFSAGWPALVAYELQTPVGYHFNEGGASTLVREWLVRRVDLLKNKRLVVWQFVERDLRYGAGGWRDLDFDIDPVHASTAREERF